MVTLFQHQVTISCRRFFGTMLLHCLAATCNCRKLKTKRHPPKTTVLHSGDCAVVAGSQNTIDPRCNGCETNRQTRRMAIHRNLKFVLPQKQVFTLQPRNRTWFGNTPTNFKRNQGSHNNTCLLRPTRRWDTFHSGVIGGCGCGVRVPSFNQKMIPVLTVEHDGHTGLGDSGLPLVCTRAQTSSQPSPATSLRCQERNKPNPKCWTSHCVKTSYGVELLVKRTHARPRGIRFETVYDQFLDVQAKKEEAKTTTAHHPPWHQT